MQKLDLSNVRFSKRDIEKGIRIPKYLTEELAYDLGVHIGDGSINLRKNRLNSTTITLSSNSNEIKYLKNVIKTREKLYNLNKYRIIKRNKERNLIYHSLALSTFYKSVFGIPWGKKLEIDAPEIIKNSKNLRIITSFIRGLVDTDFGVIRRVKYGKLYISIEGSSKSKKLIKSLSLFVKKLNIEHYNSYDIKSFDKRTNKTYTRNKIILNGFKRTNLFFKTIRPLNQKYKKEYGLEEI